jgi:predicted small metal-binding protein
MRNRGSSIGTPTFRQREVPSIRGEEVGSMIKEVTCECGFYARGTEEDLIPVVQAHGRSKHGLDVTREQVLAQLKPVEA